MCRGNSLKDQAIEAFSVFSSHHGFTIRKDVTAGMFDAFPTRAQLLIKLNEDGEYVLLYIMPLHISYLL